MIKIDFNSMRIISRIGEPERREEGEMSFQAQYLLLSSSSSSSYSKVNAISIKSILISIIILLEAITSSVLATSNINSIWLSNGDPLLNTNNVKTKFKTPKSAISSNNNYHTLNVNNNNEGDTHKTYAANNAPPQSVIPLASSATTGSGRFSQSSAMAASSSSLQPSIVSYDPSSNDNNKQRRSDFEYPSKNYSNFSDFEAGSSVDNSWAGQLPAGKSSSSSSSNAQVQFDDLIRLGNSSTTFTNYPTTASDRRQDQDQLRQLLSKLNDTRESTTSTLTPQHYALNDADLQLAHKPPTQFNISSSQQQFLPEIDQRVQDISRGLSSGKLSKSNRSRSSESPFVYYLPNGDKWNYAPELAIEPLTVAPPPLLTTPKSVVFEDKQPWNSNRRKLHTSGIQYDLRETGDELAFGLPQNSHFHNDLQTEALVDFDQKVRRRNQLNQEAYPSYQIDPTTSNEWASSQPIKALNQLNSGFVALAQDQERGGVSKIPTNVLASNQQQFLYRTTPTPHYHSVPLPAGYILSQSTASQPQQTPGKMLFQIEPQTSLRTQSNSFAGFQPIQLYENNNNYPRRNEHKQIINKGYKPVQLLNPNNQQRRRQTMRSKSEQSGKSGLFRYISKPKRSLLNVFSSVIGAGQSDPSRQALHQLEASFYDSPPTLRAPVWSAGSVDQLPPSASVIQSVTQPFQQDTEQQQASYLRHSSALAYYPNPSGGLFGSHYAPPLAASIEHPTVAPVSTRYQALASYQNPYIVSSSIPRRRRVTPTSGDHMKHLAKGAGQPSTSGAAFIPIVAVQVTKTSPAPRIPEEPVSEDSLSANESPTNNNEASSSAIGEYLEMKLNGRRPSNFNQASSLKVGSEQEFGNVASGSISSNTVNKQRPHQSQHSSGPGSQTTTVKSAVFGYLPHQAQQPLLQALNILPEYTAQTMRASHAEHVFPASHYHSLNDEHSHQQQADEPAVQLEANSLAQNDIANSFYEYTPPHHHHHHEGQHQEARPAAMRPHYYAAASNSHPARQVAAAFELFPAQQAQLHGFQIIPNSVSTSGSSDGQNRIAFNPLLASYPGSVALGHHQLMSSASETNPLLPFMFAASPQNQDARGQQHQHGSQKNDYSSTTSTTTESSANLGDHSNNDDDDDNDDDDHHGKAHQQVSKGRKRSGDFFANAGQLLLSALPLLLAPTLGLMFASSPSQVGVARYHPPLSSSGLSPSGSAPAPSLAANYASLDSISTSTTAAPIASNTFTPSGNTHSAKLFTQSPLEFGYPATDPSQTGINRNISHQSVKARKPTGKPTKTTPAPPRTTIILTTLGPPPFSNDSIEALEAKASLTNHTTMHAKQTIMVITDQELDSLLTGKNDSLNIQQAPSKLKSQLAYDLGGYEGADFDAQFASLRKHSQPSMMNNSTSSFKRANNSTSNIGLILNNQHHLVNVEPFLHRFKPNNNTILPHLTKNQYQYSEVSFDPAYDLKFLDSGNKSLFPVTTWPPMRRKTVNLVTSNGNKTLPDSSDKYNRFSVLEFASIPGSQIDQMDVYARSGNFSSSLSTNFDDDSDQDFYLNPANKTILGTNKTYTITVAKPLPVMQPLTDLAMSDNFASEALIRLKRVKRSQGESSRRLVKVVKKIVRVPANSADFELKQATSGSGQMVDMASAMLPSVVAANSNVTDEARQQEVMTDDASRNKPAHIITTMITHSDDGSVDYDSSSGSVNGTTPMDEDYPNNGPGTSGPDVNQVLEAVDELKEQAMRRKMIIDRMEEHRHNHHYQQQQVNNNRSHRYPTQEPGEFESVRAGYSARLSPSGASALDQFSAGGRGRIQVPIRPRPSPIELTSTKIRFFPNETMSQGTAKQRLYRGGGSVFPDDNRKSMNRARDWPNQPAFRQSPNNNAQMVPMKFRRELERLQPPMRHSNDRKRYEQHDVHMSAATESSFLRTTPLPGPYPDRHELNYTSLEPSRYHNHHNQHHHHHQHQQQHQHPPPRNYSYLANEYHHQNNNYSPVRDRVNLIENDQEGSGLGGSDEHNGHYLDYYQANGYGFGNRTSSYPANVSQHNDTDHYHHDNQQHSARLDRAQSYGVNSHAEAAYSQPGYSSAYYPPPPRPYSSAPNYDTPPPRYPPPQAPYRPYQPNQQDYYNFSQPYYNQHKQSASDWGSSHPPGDLYQPTSSASGSYKHTGEMYQKSHYPSGGYHHESSSYGPDYYPAARYHQTAARPPHFDAPSASSPQIQGGPIMPPTDRNQDPAAVNDYLKRVQFSDSDRDKLMASYLTCDGLLNDNDHCLERLSCEFSDPQNIEKANKLDRAVSSILLGHILINTYIPNQFKMRLKSASLFGYTQSGKCSRFVCNKLTKTINASAGTSNLSNSSKA